MKHSLLFMLFCSIMICASKAQVFIEPVIGFQKDFNNNKFKLLATGVQCSFKMEPGYELLIMAKRSWGFSVTGNDTAYTINPTLPLFTGAAKKTVPSAFSLALGHRIRVAESKAGNKLALLLYTGITFQHFAVNYQYDKDNYTVLNPDGPLNRDGLYLSGGVEYMRRLGNGRVFFQLLVSTPPTGKESKYPNSFHAMAPVNFNAGYSIIIKQKKK